MLLNKFISFLIKKYKNEKFLSDNFVMYSNEYISKQIMLNGVYEKHEILGLIQNIIPKTKKKVFFDIGANIGNHSCALGKYFDQVYSFEPFGLNFSLLKINTSKLKNIKAFNYACGNKNSKNFLYVNDNYNLGRISSKKEPGSNSSKFEIEFINTDKFIEKKNIKNIDLIKIDVEGDELNVLKGLDKTLKDQSPIILLEIHFYKNNLEALSLIKLLNKLNYIYFYEFNFHRLQKMGTQKKFLRIIYFLIAYFNFKFFKKNFFKKIEVKKFNMQRTYPMLICSKYKL